MGLKCLQFIQAVAGCVSTTTTTTTTATTAATATATATAATAAAATTTTTTTTDLFKKYRIYRTRFSIPVQCVVSDIIMNMQTISLLHQWCG